jgi:hypothetical protein
LTGSIFTSNLTAPVVERTWSVSTVSS